MKNVTKGFLAILTLSSCATTVRHIEEPSRTDYYMACVNETTTVTDCECVEERTLAVTKKTKVESQKDADVFVEESRNHVNECVKESAPIEEQTN